MKHDIQYAPSFAMARFDLDAGEEIVVEAGSMVGMSSHMGVKTSIGGTKQGFFGKIINFFIAFIRKFLGGESMFFNTYSPAGKAGTLYVSPALVGDLLPLQLTGGKGVIIQPGSFVCATPGVVLKTKWGGLKAILGREGAFLLKAEGEGTVWVNAYGGIKEVECTGSFIVDTGHMVAFDESLNYKLRMAGGGAWTAFKSGEGFVFEFQGHGKLLLQSRNLDTLVSWITPALP